MAFPRRFGVSFTRRILVGFCFLGLIFFRPKVIAAAGEVQVQGTYSYGEGYLDDIDVVMRQDHNSSDVVTIAGGAGGGRYELCGTDVSVFLPPPYGNISNMVCSPIWNTYVLRYLQRADNVMTIVLSAIYTSGWVGIGFSQNGMMVGSSAMVGWVNLKGMPRIKQYYLQGPHSSQVIPDKGELQLENVPPVVVTHGAMIYLAFQVKFQTRLGRQPIILAFGAKTPSHFHLKKHDDRTSVVFDFSKASVFDIASSHKTSHGILGLFAWGLILPVGAIIARHLKHKDPLWYYLHAGIQFVGFIIGLAGVLLGIQLHRRIKADLSGHNGIGIFVFVLSILQILAFFLRPNKDSKIRKFWNWYHHWLGRIALFFGALNVVLGIHIGGAGNGWKIGYGFLISVILVAVIVLEAFSYMRRSESDKNTRPPTFQMNPM